MCGSLGYRVQGSDECPCKFARREVYQDNVCLKLRRDLEGCGSGVEIGYWLKRVEWELIGSGVDETIPRQRSRGQGSLATKDYT